MIHLIETFMTSVSQKYSNAVDSFSCSFAPNVNIIAK